MSFAIIKDDKIIYFSSEKPQKAIAWVYEEKINEETGEKEKVCLKEPVEWINFDTAIDIWMPYDYTYDYFISDWKIEMKIKDEFKPIIRTKEDIKQEIWTLIIERNWMIELWEDIYEIDSQIQLLKDEYNMTKYIWKF